MGSLLSWSPLGVFMQNGIYFELKLAFLLWLLFPGEKGTGATIVYNKLLSPILEKYEGDIDQSLDKVGGQIGKHTKKISANLRDMLRERGASITQAFLETITPKTNQNKDTKEN